jgi:hypothetical protein
MIISLLKTILAGIDSSNSFDRSLPFLVRRTVWTFFLFLPTWILLLHLNNKETNIENIGWFSRFLGIVFGLFLFVFFQLYEYEIILKSRSFKKEDLKLRRSIILVGEIYVVWFSYIAIISFNKPFSSLKNWQAPTLLYVLLIICLLTLFVGFIAFVFDRSIDERLDADTEKKTKLSKHTFYWSVILFLIVFSGSAYGVFAVDHYFKLEDSQLPATKSYQKDFQQAIWNRLCEAEFDINKTQTCDENKPKSLVVVAASGGGIQASGWMTQVLAGLQEKKLGIGEDFTKAIGLISSASGGSVGSMFYLDQFDKDKKVLGKEGLAKTNKNSKLYQVVENATDDWLNSVGWGLASPDLFRAIGLPIFKKELGGDNKPYLYLDRGYALEKNWEKTLTVGGKKPPTLDDRREQVLAGQIPIAVYNTTLVENGRPFFVSPMKFVEGTMAKYAKESSNKLRNTALDFKTLYNNCGANGDQPCDLAVTTAARLSASFPYVTPMARNDRENLIKVKVKDKNGKETKIDLLQNYHIADGGYYDNAGAFTAMNWLNEFLTYNNSDDNQHHRINIKKVVILQINAFPENNLELDQQGSPGFVVTTIGPLNTLNGIRDSTQIGRNKLFVELLKDRWHNDKNEENNISIQDFTISFPESKPSKDKDGNLIKDKDGKEINIPYNPPLSWRLTELQKKNLVEAWETDTDIRNTVNNMTTFWAKPKI